MAFMGITRGELLDANLITLFLIALGVKRVTRSLFPSDPVTKENRAWSLFLIKCVTFQCIMLMTWISGILLTQTKCIDLANCHANDSAQHDSDFRRLVKMSIALFRSLTTQCKGRQQTNCCLDCWIESIWERGLHDETTISFYPHNSSTITQAKLVTLTTRCVALSTSWEWSRKRREP